MKSHIKFMQASMINLFSRLLIVNKTFLYSCLGDSNVKQELQENDLIGEMRTNDLNPP